MRNEPVSERLAWNARKAERTLCRDLKRLEQLEESNEDLKKLTIEIKNLVKLNNGPTGQAGRAPVRHRAASAALVGKVCGGNRHSVRRSDRRLSAHDDCPGDYQGVVVKQVKEEKE